MQAKDFDQQKFGLLLPPCCHSDLSSQCKIAGSLELYGVPGQVRTAHFPLRRAGAVITL